MKIAVVAAAGKAGRKIVAEATNRGFEVTAFVRRRGQIVDGAKHTVVKDIMELTADDLKGFDAIVDAFGTFTPETLPLHTTTSQHLCDILSGSDTRLLIIGGAGSLYVDKEHKTQLFTTPDFPAAYVPTAQAQANELAELRKRDDVKWTFVSPACDFQADGERTGKYLLGGEELIFNAAGESVISYADFAVAMVDEIAGGNHVKQRIGVVKA